METTNDEEGLTPAESALPAIDAPGEKRNKNKGEPSLARKRKVVKKGHVTSPSINKKGQVTPQSTKKKILVHDETQAIFPENPPDVSII